MHLNYYANGYKLKCIHIIAILSLQQTIESKLYSFSLLINFQFIVPFFFRGFQSIKVIENNWSFSCFTVST